MSTLAQLHRCDSPLTVAETADMTRLDRATVARLVEAGVLPTVRTPGGEPRIRPADLIAAYRRR